MTHYMAHMVWVRVTERYQMLGRQTLSTFGFGFGVRPKVPLYFRWYIYGFGRMCYVTFGLLSVSAESKTSAFGRPLDGT